MIDLSIYDYPGNLTEFTVKKALSAKLLWINIPHSETLGDSSVENLERIFFDKFSYVIENSEFRESVKFDPFSEKFVFAERYGGGGLGTNGGGARCGNIENFQIKGIGRNNLAGISDDHWHGYGGLNLVDAIYETINSTVLGRVMPAGTVQIHGLIILGEDTAILPGLNHEDLQQRRGFGALLVRDACIRPAHFLKNPGFESGDYHAENFLSDEERVDCANKIFLKKFSNINDFIKTLGYYISNYASQFAFARAARIFHGSISPSNICLDGRWLDLTNASFLPGGFNPSGRPPFYMERVAAMGFIEELINTISTSNKINLNSKKLLDYYVEQYFAYFKVHLGYVIGIDINEDLYRICNVEIDQISECLSNAISCSPHEAKTRCYEYNDSDPVLCFLESLFISINSISAAKRVLQKTADSNGFEVKCTSKVFLEFEKITRNYYDKITVEKISYKVFITTISIIALKRSMISEYFYMGRLENYIFQIVKEKKENIFKPVIDDSIYISRWAFNKNEVKNSIDENQVIIFKSYTHTLCYNLEKDIFQIHDSYKNLLFSSKKYSNTLNYIHLNKIPTFFSNYNFWKYLLRLNNVLKNHKEGGFG